MEAAAGFEPANKGFADLSLSRLGTPPAGFKRSEPVIKKFKTYGAGDGIRTRDPNLGKVVLYQLSYARSYQMDILNYAYYPAPVILLS